MKKKQHPHNEKICMSIGPWGVTDAEQAYRQDLELVLNEVCEKRKLTYKPFWDAATSDMPSGIFEMLVSAKLVIADLRGLNPNVMYELGIRHAFNLPTVLLKDPATKLSWDIDKNFVLTYPLPIQISQKQILVNNLEKQIDKVLEEQKKNNPVFSSFITSVQRSMSIEKLNVDVDLKSTLETLLNKVDRLTNMNNSSKNPDSLTPNHLNAWVLVEQKGMSQMKAAEMLGLSQGRISQLLQEYREFFDLS